LILFIEQSEDKQSLAQVLISRKKYAKALLTIVFHFNPMYKEPTEFLGRGRT